MMRRRILTALTALLILIGVPAQAEEFFFDGTVVAQQTQRITAPFGGTLTSLDMREGERVESGSALAQVAGEKFFSPLDGTVRGVEAQPGDSAEGGLFSIAPVSKFTIQASVAKAYESVETKYITVGERLYISCAMDGTHRAEGIVTAADGLNFTVETDRGELYMEENVYLYRSEDYSAATRVGYGAVSRSAEIKISADGSLLALYVQEGEEVERGQLLFETAQGTFAGGEIPSGTVCAPCTGVIAQLLLKAGDSVSQGDVIATMYAPEDFRIQIAIPEEQVGRIHPGDAAIISFSAHAEEWDALAGTVGEISAITDSETQTVSYSAYIDFDASDSMRLGMTASVVIADSGS